MQVERIRALADLIEQQPHAIITPSHAAAVLRHLAATGEVDWTVGVSG